MGYGSLVQKIVYKVSGRVAASSGLYVPMDYQYDYAIGGIPLLSATGDTRPDTEKPVPQRKDQFDAFKDPGEYSLNQWWLRSQSSFSGGAGIVYQDPDTQGTAKNIRFAQSLGVDPFTDPDLLGLLRETEQCTAIGGTNSGFAYLASQINGFGDCVWVARGDTVEMRQVAASDLTINSTAVIPTSGSTQSITGDIATFKAVSGIVETYFAVVFMADYSSVANSGIWRVDEGSAAATRIYQPPANINFPTIAKARGLIAFGSNNSLYMLDPYAAANTALPVSPNAAIPVDQTIVSITDGPDAVYVGANDDLRGYIYKSTFDTNGLVNGLTLTAVLPDGEKINDCQAYVSTFMVITSNSGIRVGSFTSSGISYGPQILTVPVTPGDSGFGKIAFYGNRAYIATLGESQHQGSKGIMAVDLGTLINDTNTGAVFNPYCTWTYFPANTDAVQDVCTTRTGRVAFSAEAGIDAKVYVEHESKLIESGFLDTGRCRFNTIEPKLFKYFSIRTPVPLLGEVTVAVLDDSGGMTNYVTYGPNLDPGTGDIATPNPGGPRNWEALRFTLRRSATDVTVGGELDSWQIKALPGTLKQRMLVHQFLCFNSMEDKTGNRIAGDQQSISILTAIRQMCQRGDTVTFQDLAQDISTQVIIDDYQFTMLTTPGPNKENYGGYLTVTMRTVADAVTTLVPNVPEPD
jgi:hypothetical protein